MIEPSAPPPNYDEVISSLNKNQKIYDLVRKYEIDPLFSEKLEILSQYEIEFTIR